MTSASVRVALRVRPLNSKETLQNCSECLTIIPDAPQILIGTDRSFTFDYVFPSETEQDDVFQDCARPLLDKLVEGQTGSGKTYSMGTALDGSNIPPEHIGIVPRAIYRLFEDLNERKINNPTYEFEVLVSFLELYNEDLIDLLNPQNREHHKKGKSDLTIREDANGQIYWSGVKEVSVSTPDELLGHLQKGSLCRTVASTDMNMVSSRSHAIFSVILKQTKVETLEENKENDAPPAETSSISKRKSKQKALTSKVISKFHFVDLAGSERLKRTNAVGDRAKEGIAINGGLLALGNVISALGDESRKVTHIPYRDSKLTRLLQDSLGGNSQTLMLACVSPADSNFMETLNTLKYANRARNIKNKVSVNENFGGNSVEINQLRGQISRLKMEIQTLISGGCNEETSRKYDEEIKVLKGELGMTKMKLHSTEQELLMVRTEKNTLLMDINFNGQDLSDADREHKMKTHHIVQSYETEIFDLKNQIADLQAAQSTTQNPRKSSLAKSAGRDKNHQKKGKKKKRRSSSRKSKPRADSHFPVSDETSAVPLDDPSSSFQLQPVKPSNLDDAKNLFSHYEDDIIEENEENIDEYDENARPDGENWDGEGQFKFTRKLRRRSKTRDKLEKAKEQIKQGLLFIKNGGSLHDDPLLSQLVKLPSSTKSESYIDQMMPNNIKEKRRSSSVSFSEIQTIEVPTWQESNPAPQPTTTTTRRTSNSSRSVSFSEQISPGSTKSSQNSTGCSSQQQNAIALTRMLHQIQADIAVKEQLVTQLERAEQEFTYMRAQYEQKLANMQENLINLQRERDVAAKRAQNSGSGVSTRDKGSILAELKARYEHKMKRLIQEIGELRRKYNEATQSNNTSKNQNETMLKSMRAQIEQLKAEKMRMMKRMKDEAERVREMTERNQREIQTLRRKEKVAQEQKKRLERTSEMQKIMLEKRQKEMLQTAGKLKSVMTLLKRTSTPKAISKVFRNHKRNQVAPEVEDGKELRRTSDDLNAIHDEVFASGYDKKRLLDEAIFKYISGRQTLAMMDELIVKREKLQEEKKELLEERERIIISECGNELDGDAQALDDKIEMIDSEMTYINARIRGLQSEAARGITTEQEENENHRDNSNREGETSKDAAEKPRKNSKIGKSEKKLSFSLPENATPETSYDTAVHILRSLDSYETQAVLESFFKDIVDLRTGDWSRQMTLGQQDKQIMDLRKTLLAMRRAAVLTTVEYEKKNKELEEALRRGERAPSPITSEKKELQMDDIENDASNTISLFDRIYDQALAQVEAAVSRRNSIIGTPGSRRNSYLFESDDAAFFSSPVNASPLSGSPMNSGNRTSFSRPPIPSGWLNLQSREKGTAESNEAPNAPTSITKRKDSSESTGSNSGSINNVKRKSSNGRKLKRPTNNSSHNSSNPSTPKDENVPSNVTNTVSMDVGSSHEHPRGPLPLERTRSGGQASNSRRGSLQSSILHSRQNSSTSMGFYAESGNHEPRDSGYFSSADKRRSQSSMARRGSKDITAAYHMRQSSYGRTSPDSDDAESVTSMTSERRASLAHHTHIRSETPPGDNVFDRLAKSKTQSSSAKNSPAKPTKKVKEEYHGERRGSVTKGHSKQGGGVKDALAALEGRRGAYAETVKAQA
ncbi:19599_t:CDS:2 [Funneliformis geosporum]|uniref:19599_t:CDS:1 n=1 Tax=Funneliformis geosporum TaxID=1117311 RepID=A0A9W4SBA9_9GLOM|nr:19599_t:CDS:2 [Funneliformis geosporum]